MGESKFCLHWKDFDTNMTKALKDLREENDFFDVTIACEDNQVQAHKVILSACSTFFRNILRRNPHQHPLLYLKGVKYKQLLDILDFMYNGEVNVVQEELKQFLSVAADLRVQGLTQKMNIPPLPASIPTIPSSLPTIQASIPTIPVTFPSLLPNTPSKKPRTNIQRKIFAEPEPVKSFPTQYKASKQSPETIVQLPSPNTPTHVINPTTPTITITDNEEELVTSNIPAGAKPRISTDEAEVKLSINDKVSGSISESDQESEDNKIKRGERRKQNLKTKLLMSETESEAGTLPTRFITPIKKHKLATRFVTPKQEEITMEDPLKLSPMSEAKRTSQLMSRFTPTTEEKRETLPSRFTTIEPGTEKFKPRIPEEISKNKNVVEYDRKTTQIIPSAPENFMSPLRNSTAWRCTLCKKISSTKKVALVHLKIAHPQHQTTSG